MALYTGDNRLTFTRRFLQFSHPPFDFRCARLCLDGSKPAILGTSERVFSESDVVDSQKVVVESSSEECDLISATVIAGICKGSTEQYPKEHG
jgi:hypothetical protein